MTAGDEAAAASLADPAADESGRRVVLVAGSGRSGTSTLAGVLQRLGLHVPQPEVVADETNPRGFAEPRWVVDFHADLLRRCGVHGSDARPQAWAETGRFASREAHRTRLEEWLLPHFAKGPELVVKDPRLAWWLDLWREVAARCDATPVVVTMLRPPTEVVASKETYYGSRLATANRAAAWVNMMLHTELATRGGPRAFVRYRDLLTDWRSTVTRLGRDLGIATVAAADEGRVRAADEFVDPALRRLTTTWADLAVPAWLAEVAEAGWEQLDRLADPAQDVPEVHAALDELRAAYAERYAEAEAVAQSSALAERAGAGRRVERLRKRAAKAEKQRDLARRRLQRQRSRATTDRARWHPALVGLRRRLRAALPGGR